MIRRKVNYNSPFAYYEIANSLLNYIKDDTVIICIGSDKCIGDCLGPLVGTLLESKFFPLPIYGTINHPIHALNINNRLDEINKLHPKSCIIGIDACLGDVNSIGEIHTRDYAIHPGKGVGKNLPKVGVASIIGIVDSTNNSDYFSSHSIRLALILDMANVIANAIMLAYSTNKNINYI